MRGLARLALPAFAVVALLGCRAIVGIEPTELNDAGDQGDAGDDGATGTDGSAKGDDGGVPADGGADGAPLCTGNPGDCLHCCRDLDKQANGALEGYMKSTGCLCGAGACVSECASSTCTDPPGAPQSTCVQCIDGLIHDGTCGAAFDACKGDQNCAIAAQCIEACPK